jgi:haloalkane dehalogenase
MTNPAPLRSRPTDRPQWLTDAVWPFAVRSIDVGGHRMAFTDTGGDGPVLLFCHAGLWSLVWRDLVLGLQGEFRCVTFDAPGCGLSPRVGPDEQPLSLTVQGIGTLIDALDLRDITLVLHDVGGLAALAAVNERADRISAVAAVNTFGWRPRGVLLPFGLRVFGSAPIRELDAFSGFLPRASSTRFGVGRHLSKASRQAWRAGISDRARRRMTHRLFRDAAHNHSVHRDAEQALASLADRPLLTVFGQFGDYLRFQREWRRRRPDLTPRTVPRGLHFPMCDDPELVGRYLRDWLREQARERPDETGL